MFISILPCRLTQGPGCTGIREPARLDMVFVPTQLHILGRRQINDSLMQRISKKVLKNQKNKKAFQESS